MASMLKKSPQQVLVTSHLAPDGDCIGSMLALSAALAAQGVDVFTVYADKIPQAYGYLEGSNILLPSLLPSIPETVILLDCTDLERVGPDLSPRLKQAKCILNIDHHVSNNYFGHYNLVEPQAAATGEIIYRLLQLIGTQITPAIATALYTAIVTDTGSFQFENTTATTLQIASELMTLGADLGAVRENLWEQRPLISLRVLAAVLPTLTMTPDGRVAWMYLDKDTADNLGATSENCEGLIDYPRSISGVEVGLFFREVEINKIKVGFRSKKLVDVNQVAGKFGGGGHRRAAGCTVSGTLSEVINQVLTVVSREI
jgi:phosphoesterase RecJ-like protein